MNRSNLKRTFAAFAVLFCSAFGIGLALANSAGNNVPYTDDFGDKSCRLCHETYRLNDLGGEITILGVPDQYAAGQTYRLMVRVIRSGISRWGFQLTSRIASGASAGRQAGLLRRIDSATASYQWPSDSYLGIQVIHQTSSGSSPYQLGTWSVEWTAPDTNVGDIRFSAVVVAADNDGSALGDYVYAMSATASPPSELVSAVFPHVAVGGGYKTRFILQNTGNSTVSGTLLLKRNDGAELAGRVITGSVDEIASNVPVVIEAAGTRFIDAMAQNDPDPTLSGWAIVESSGGSLSGVAIFQYESEGRLQTTAGVHASMSTATATIAVDEDDPAERYTGYAVANPGNEPITIRAVLVPENGVSGGRIPLASIALEPYSQKAAFIMQDPATPGSFRGSLVLIGVDGKKFGVTALVQNRGLLTSIPVAPSKADAIN